jgi:zinc D-Ala-D-Ala carboxypeptidase
MKYFQYHEFDEHGNPGTGAKYMDSTFLQMLDQLREKCGFPLEISSGYRSPEYNAAVSKTGENGPHTTGKAADIKVSGTNAYILLKHAFAMGFTGIGISQKGAHQSRFIHLDILGSDQGPRPVVWSY